MSLNRRVCCRSRCGGSGRADVAFTLVEVLVVMVVTGILAAIAIPVFLVQRGNAADAATKRDVVSVAKLVVAAFAEGRPVPTVRIVGDQYEVDGEVLGPVSAGVAVAGVDPAGVDTTGWSESAWCLSLTNPSGHLHDFKYSAQAGLQAGDCTSPTAP